MNEEPESVPESEEWPPYLVPYRVRLLDGEEVEVLAWPCVPPSDCDFGI